MHCAEKMKSSLVFLFALTLCVSHPVESSPLGPKMHAVLRQRARQAFYSHNDMLGSYSRGRVSGADNLCPTTLEYTAVTPPNNVDQFSYQRKFSETILSTLSSSRPLIIFFFPQCSTAPSRQITCSAQAGGRQISPPRTLFSKTGSTSPQICCSKLVMCLFRVLFGLGSLARKQSRTDRGRSLLPMRPRKRAGRSHFPNACSSCSLRAKKSCSFHSSGF